MGSDSVTNRADGAAPSSKKSSYAGPRDVGRAESLYRSGISKPDLDYSADLLFSALIANPEHEGAFAAILAKIPTFVAAKRRMVVRVSDSLVGSPAEQFVKALVAYCAAPRTEEALNCAIEAQKAALFPYGVQLGSRILQRFENGDSNLKASAASRLIDVFESCGAMAMAVRAAQAAVRLFPDDASFPQREKNLMAKKYLKDTDIESSGSYRDNLRDRPQQEQMHRAIDPNTRLDELEQRFQQSGSLEDFRELMRGLRESNPARREAALPLLEQGMQRFGENQIRWFIQEIKLERKAAELRLHQKLLDENPTSEALRRDHEQLRQEVLVQRIDHLYEVVSALPSTPERMKRQLELAATLFDAGRYEQAIKQSQLVKRRGDGKIEAWVIMAKSFVQLGLTQEASDCFQSILSQLSLSAQGSIERVLDAKYEYAQFLAQEALRTRNSILARQARKFCSDVMIEDIDYRDVRKLAERVDQLGGAGS